MFCEKCGSKNEGGAKFCAGCGETLAVTTGGGFAGGGVLQAKPMILMAVLLLTFFWGILFMFGGGTGLLSALSIGNMLGNMPGTFMSGQDIIFKVGFLSIFLMTFGVFSMTAGYGLWNLVEWGRKLTMVIYAISIPMILVVLVTRDQISGGLVSVYLVLMAIFAGIVLYLSRPSVRRFFS